MDYEIIFCPDRAASSVMEFIGRCYRPGHILSTHRALFDWQYKGGGSEGYNFVIARRKRTQQILGVLGFVDSVRYDPSLADANCVWLALWQVDPMSGVPSLGLGLLGYLVQHRRHAAIAVAGINHEHPNMYRALRYTVTHFEHYYLLNPGVREHRIAVIPEGVAHESPDAADNGVRLREVSERDFRHGIEGLRAPADVTPSKTADYFANRYLRHPFYTYTLLVAERDARAVGLLAVRLLSNEPPHRGVVARVVDVLMPEEMMAFLGPGLLRFIRTHGCDYVDCLVVGVGAEQMRRAGFYQVGDVDGVVIPNYFEPFVRKNARVLVCHRLPPGQRLVAFKGDGDQDRPNVLH